LAGTLYVVATPIGHLRDVSLRALDVLRSATRIAAEDTRHTRRLLDAHGIQGQLVAVHEHNERSAATKVVGWLQAGESVALVTDAGTPGISDPGALVVKAVRAAGLPVVPVPGPSAVVTALSAAGLAESGFEFVGFLPPKQEARRRQIADHVSADRPVVFYEAPHRVRDTIADFAAILQPDRGLTLCRELTKLFEDIHETTVGEALAWLDGDPNRTRGEFVLILHASPAEQDSPADAERVLGILLRDLSPSQAARLTAEITGARRGDLYARALALKQDAPEDASE
jgi:16S rRNA (cytidine1402-2'-O)-methyltransferase